MVDPPAPIYPLPRRRHHPRFWRIVRRRCFTGKTAPAELSAPDCDDGCGFLGMVLDDMGQNEVGAGVESFGAVVVLADLFDGRGFRLGRQHWQCTIFSGFKGCHSITGREAAGVSLWRPWRAKGVSGHVCIWGSCFGMTTCHDCYRASGEEWDPHSPRAWSFSSNAIDLDRSATDVNPGYATVLKIFATFIAVGAQTTIFRGKSLPQASESCTEGCTYSRRRKKPHTLQEYQIHQERPPCAITVAGSSRDTAPKGYRSMRVLNGEDQEPCDANLDVQI